MTLLGAIPLAVVTGPTLAVAWLMAGVTGAVAAAVGFLVAAAIWAASELLVVVVGLNQPLERLLLGMLIRGGGALTAVAVGVLAAGAHGKLIAGVALPLYGSLIAGELLVARRLQDAGATE